MLKKTLLALLLAATAVSASAQSSIGLSNYRLSGNYALDRLGEMGLEASAVSYARDRNSLFFVGDEGEGVVEVSLTGQTLGSMRFSGWPTASRYHDAEGLAYLGNGRLVVLEERIQSAFRFDYLPGGSVNLAQADYVNFGTYASNTGAEGISYDARDGSFVVVKENNPQRVLSGSLSFAASGGTSGMTPLFEGSNLFGLKSLSDVQTLSAVDSFAGTAAADNLLILSYGSRQLVEINRAGDVLGRFDLSGITGQAIEGVTVDQHANIYLVAENSKTNPNSRLFVLSPVPEPETWGMLLAGLPLLIGVARRKQRLSA